MKISILSNVNMDLLANKIKKRIPDAEFYISGYGQYAQEIINSGSGLKNAESDYVILHMEGGELFPNLVRDPLAKPFDAESILQQVHEIEDLVNIGLEQLKKARFLLNTIVLPPRTLLGNLEGNSLYSIRRVQSFFNEKLADTVEKLGRQRVLLCDWESVVLEHGYVSIYDRRLWYLGRIPYSETGLVALAEHYQSAIRAGEGHIKKVLVLDLDNTLWGGIIGEDGIDGIKLGENGHGKAFRDFQTLVKSMKRKGVLITVVSKNNEADAMEVFEKHPMQILKKDDLVSYRINWAPKSQNIEDLALELNLGLDSFVFIDDNPVERMEVKESLPMVDAPDFPDDLSSLPDWFLKIDRLYFNQTAVTIEDGQRSELYRSEVKRKTFQDSSKNLEGFLSSLEMKATVSKNNRVMLSRIAQLTQRTNQFNLTTRRYTEDDIEKFMTGGLFEVYDVELTDRFGSNGIVGIGIVSLEEDRAVLDSFLLSCRVIGRTLEEVFIGSIMRDVVAMGANILEGQYRATKKNILTKELFNNWGFEYKGTHEDGHEIWLWDLVEKKFPIPEYIDVKWKTAE